MRVHFYGTSAAMPGPNRGFACIGVRWDSHSVLLDCGDGSVRRLVQDYADIPSITDIMVTHYHSDHVSGLASIIEAMAMKKKTTGLKVYGPPGLKEYLFTVLKVTNTGYNRKFEINPVELNANQSLRVGNCKVSAFQMDHTLPSLGYRLEDDSIVVAYTGDTKPCEGSSLLARDANLLIHEATYLQADLEKASSSKHSTSKQGAETASSAGAKKLVLTHVLETSETPEQMISEASSVFGETTVASDGMEIAL